MHDKIYDEIKAILIQCKGKSNAMTSKRISVRINFPMEDTQVKTRTAIWETAKIFELPLISCSKGYFIAETDNEMNEYNSNIQSRIDGMEETRRMTNENYHKWKEHNK